MKPLTQSKTSQVFTAPLGRVSWIYHHVAKTDAQRARVADWVKAAYLPKLEALGYQRKPGESA